jgi:hypothetical protein
MLDALITAKNAYRLAAFIAIGTSLFLLWGIGALGVIGEEGDSADRMYLGVLAVGLGGALLARFRPAGMARALLAMALGMAVVAVIAIALGKHNEPGTSVSEILGLTAFFATPLLVSAWLFRFAAQEQAAASRARS